MAFEALRQLASTPATPPQEGFSLGGLLSNLGGGALDLVQGLAQLGIGAVKDVVTSPIGTLQDIGQLALEVGTAGTYKQDPYHTGTGALLSQLPTSIASDIASRYGPLLPGGAPASESYRALYEQPLSFVLDALAVGGAAASGAKAVGSAAVRGSEAASLAAKEAAQGLIAAGVRPRTAAAAGTRSGLEALSAERALGPLEAAASRILPKSTNALVGDRLVPTAQIRNPVTRLAVSPIQRTMTEPIGTMEARVGAMAGEIAVAGELGQKVPETLVAEYGLRSSILQQVQEAGLTRVTKPGTSDRMASLAARRFMASTNARFIKTRLKDTRHYEQALVPILREVPELADEGSAWATGLNSAVPGYEPAPWFSAQQARATVPLDTRALVPAMVGGGLAEAPALRTLLSDAGQAALDGVNPIAQRTEAVVQRLRAYKARLVDPEDLVQQRIADAGAEAGAVDRIIDELYSDLDRQLLHDAPGPETVVGGSRMVGTMRLLDMEKMADEFDTLQSTPRQVLEETYVPLRLKYGAQWDESGTVLQGGPSVEELDDAFRASEQAAPTYFPFIDPERMRTSDWFTSKKPVGANVFARDPHVNRMKGVLLMEGSYLRNPVEALTRRAARGVRAQETFRQMMDAVSTFGRPISKSDDLPPGYAVIAPDLLFLHKRTGFKLEDTLDDLLSQGMDRDSAMAQALESVTLKNMNDVATLLEAGNVKMWAVPKVVANRLNDAAQAAGFAAGKTRLWYDTVIGSWRGLVLSGSPRWVVNNTLGNTMFAAMQGVKTADVMRSLAAHFKEVVLKRESTFLRELRKLPGYEDVPSGFVGSTVAQYEAAKPGLASSKTYQLLNRVGQTRPATWAQNFGRGMRTLNTIIEDSFRSASYLTAAERALGISGIRRTARSFMGSQRRIANIAERGFDEVGAKAALAEVTHFFGDYGALGPYERHVFRRWLFPFYSFYKHQAKLLLSFPFDYPGRTEVLKALADVNNEMMAEYGPMPEWLEGALPLGPPGGQVKFLSTRGANPFTATFQPWVSMLSPALKIPIERALGRNLFSGQEFTDPDVVSGGFGSDQRFRVIRDSSGRVIGTEPVERVTPGIIEHLLQQIPQYTLAKEAIAGGATYDTATLLDAIRGTGVIRDETGEPVFPTNIAEQAARFGGLNVYDVDLASFQQRLAEEKQAALKTALGL